MSFRRLSSLQFVARRFTILVMSSMRAMRKTVVKIGIRCGKRKRMYWTRSHRAPDDRYCDRARDLHLHSEMGPSTIKGA